MWVEIVASMRKQRTREGERGRKRQRERPWVQLHSYEALFLLTDSENFLARLAAELMTESFSAIFRNSHRMHRITERKTSDVLPRKEADSVKFPFPILSVGD